MPDINDEELGRRLFITNREKSVEEALQKIRHSLGHSWNIFSTSDISALTSVLGELWVAVERSDWGTYTFSRLDSNDVDELVAIGKKIEKDTRVNPADLSKAKDILHKTL